MTHFALAIIVPAGVNDIEQFVGTQMTPYDENTTVAPYVCYSVEQAAKELSDSIHRLELILHRQEALFDLSRSREQLAELRRTTPEQQYQRRATLSESLDAEGRPLSTCNPNGKWDWYVIGGRWDGWIIDLDTTGNRLQNNIAPVADMVAGNKIPHAIITPDGQWHEHGQMGWWAMLLTENEHWDTDANGILSQYHDCRVVIVDAHI